MLRTYSWCCKVSEDVTCIIYICHSWSSPWRQCRLRHSDSLSLPALNEEERLWMKGPEYIVIYYMLYIYIVHWSRVLFPVQPCEPPTSSPSSPETHLRGSAYWLDSTHLYSWAQWRYVLVEGSNWQHHFCYSITLNDISTWYLPTEGVHF